MNFNKFFILAVSLAFVVQSSLLADDKLASVEKASGESWMRFRGPNGTGISTAKVPTKWSDKENIKWKIELPGPGTSSPIIVGDKLFITSYSGYVKASDDPKKLVRHLICIDRAKGKIVWDEKMPAKNPEDPAQGFINDHGYASSTPVSDGEHVYVFYGKSGAYAYDLKGKKIWDRQLGTESSDKRWGSGTSPILYEDLVIVNAAEESRTIYALDKKTGEIRWKEFSDGLTQSYSTPSLVTHNDKTTLVVSMPREVWGLNPKSGKLAWFATTGTEGTATPCVVASDDTIFVLGGRGGNSSAIKLGGKGDITKDQIWSKQDNSYVPSPIYHDKHLYWVSDQGMAICLNAESGERVYRERLGGPTGTSGGAGPSDSANRGPGGPGGQGGFGGGFGGGRGGGGGSGFYASATLIGDKIYAVSRRNGTFVYSASPKFEQVAQNKLEDTSGWNASPAAADGDLYIRSNKALYCISADKPAKE
jgi:outer membrane protein assembly factor BamB